jgi:uncharacterized 2Fe-2S/4Fe-4S cluster protein (DUF4445 family)
MALKSYSSRLIKIQLQPLGKTVEVERGTPLPEVLFEHGVEFPCGGRGRCQGCKVKVLQGSLAITPEQSKRLPPPELAAGWRLACQCCAEGDLVLDLAQWEATILADNTVFDFTPSEGYGVAVDVGTTTLVAQLLDLRTGRVLGVRAELNAQAQHGADIMSRIELAMQNAGREQLLRLVREQVERMMGELLDGCPNAREGLRRVTLVGNTAMHHLFCGLDPEPLSHYPFEPIHDGLQNFSAQELAWLLPGECQIQFLPCLGGFVGSDILAGILATRMQQSEDLTVLIDLGTNGEMVIGNRKRLLCASTAAGPAFEGARISMGMRAATGAVAEVTVEQGQLRSRVLGQATPRGICGSGLVDAVAAGLELGWIQASGKFDHGGKSMTVMAPVVLTQSDVREVQLAKGAIAAGLRILLERWPAALGEVKRIYLAGAFGNYINRQSARRIGLFEFDPAVVEPAGNTALLGAKLALFDPAGDGNEYARLRSLVEHVSLSADPRFQDIYMDALRFPAANG